MTPGRHDCSASMLILMAFTSLGLWLLGWLLVVGRLGGLLRALAGVAV